MELSQEAPSWMFERVLNTTQNEQQRLCLNEKIAFFPSINLIACCAR